MPNSVGFFQLLSFLASSGMLWSGVLIIIGKPDAVPANGLIGLAVISGGAQVLSLMWERRAESLANLHLGVLEATIRAAGGTPPPRPPGL